MGTTPLNHKLKQATLQGLYVLTDDRPDFEQRCEAIIRAQPRLLQYRDKSNDQTKRLQQARFLRNLIQTPSCLLIINDDIELAKNVGADGVHLGRNDASLVQARQLLGEQSIIGVSCYRDLKSAIEAEAAGANYLAFGRMYPSTTKPDAPACEIDILQQAKAQLQRPLVAIGGVNRQNALPLLDAGADCLAVSASVFHADDPYRAAMSMQSLFQNRMNEP